ncbi:Autoinducer 2 sensor kinase/phosphatase LuxQ [Pseudobythopirellula maris]|uniref:histidine kinase n=1 Tax=Pseudobythopirellula maris TaxID=2527991 RepID=A0A5C5ZXU6_9BACT|nr:PAS domain S-box protein [Pseudobythopirellula maris]TWT91103.1 Autoinducer 2 sensor kinase/phosphatase LuxQ [Pseudobythopirellula maris]
MHHDRTEAQRAAPQPTDSVAFDIVDPDERFRALTDCTPVMMWICGVNGRATWFNRAWLEFTGAPLEEQLGDRWTELIHTDDRGRTLTEYESSFHARRRFSLECRLRRHDGEYAWVLVSGAPLYATSGSFAGYTGSCVDVTERRRSELALQSSQQQLRAMFNQAAVGMAIVDLRGRFEEVNQRLAETLGYAAEELAKLSIEEVTHPDHRQLTRDNMRRLLSGEMTSYQQEKRYLRRDGSDVLCLKTVSLLLDERGKPQRFIAVVEDISDRRLAERRMRENEHRLRLALRASGSGVFDWDLEVGKIIWSPELEELYGLEEGDFEGDIDGWRRRVVPEDAERVTKQIEDDMAAGLDECSYEFRAVLPDGRRRWLAGEAAFYYDDAGKPLRMIGVNLDVDERKRFAEALRESEERFRMLADNMAQFAWVADAQGWIFWYNQRWYDYTGTTLEEMQGWGWRDVHHPDYIEGVVERLQYSWDTGEPWEDTFPLRGKDGEYRWFLSRALPIRDASGRILRWFGTNTDITDQRQAEEALKEADRRKDEFLAMLAHELRNPLAPIRSGLDLMALEGQGAGDLVSLMQGQVGHLVRLVDDLLDVSRIMRGKIELRREPVELGALMRSTAEAVRPLLETREHELVVATPDDDVWLDADPVRIAQVIENLLNNAAKYTPNGGRIELVAEADESRATVAVRDNGVGIDRELLPNVFELFTQASRSLDRSQGGLGIGLTVVERLVHLHGGRISVHSDGVGRGSVFTVRLPRAEAPAPASPGTVEEKRVRPLRILVVDDNASAAYMLRRLLAKLGDHRIETAADGPAALEAAAEQRPELVFLDIGLPGMDGYEVARRLRAAPGTRSAWIVALTGYGQADDRRKSAEAGFDHHLVKPADIEDLERLLADLA